ncbi:GDH/6PGL endoplasmic bifunctional protein-like [Actinia tenebrosa]|uniref:GDH/6PGL endoplasmic bifunctional protein-like n=1 Tax=Actinia tenebrosa TaxID=6105 RepID=A0A6P8I9A6_ACTTE|nr:GDH/6PGL endoplasmic bifunctional protein-like [Actinia tenebrosa]
MKSYFIVLLALSLLRCSKPREISEMERRSTQIILVGATGDLAKRYLWKGLLDLYIQQSSPEKIIKVYGAARMDQEKGKSHLKGILESTLKCPLTNKDEHMKDCGEKVVQLKQQVKYYKLKTDDDYETLCKDLNAEVPQESKALGRIFYLSVPPSAYSSIAKSINNHCRPRGLKDVNDTYIRIILEKPFGSDLASAKKLAQDLRQFFKEEEIYRIDHYLGKTGVAQIMKFRVEHRNKFGSLWNRDCIDSVEIAMKEKEDCRGRTRFYNEYGVIRDVIQNHLTEVLSLIAMDTPSDINNITEIHQKKIRFLRSVKTLHRYSAITGQYGDYVKDCELDHGKPVPSSHETPTFAAVLLFLNNSKWNGVPFVLLSGKHLEERTAYVRIFFKKKYTMKSSHDHCFLDQLIFHIQGGDLEKPALIVSKSLPTVSEFSGWKLTSSKPDYLYDCLGKSFNVFEPFVSHDAYSALIKAAYHGKQDLFISTEDLIASWEIWTRLLDSLKSVMPRIYSKDTLETLDFSIRGQRLEFAQPFKDESCSRGVLDNYGSCEPEERSSNMYKKSLFRQRSLVTGSSDEVVKTLAENLLLQASTEVIRSGVFHLALSGGSSPLALFKHLAFFCPDFPWHGTHIWLVDERCKTLTDKHSNYRFIYDNLLRYVPVPSVNVHPMPVKIKNGLCAVSDRGHNHYEAEIRRLLSDKSLDFVLLGAGPDGHTASLFPGSESLSASDWVVMTESKHIEPQGKRMTMTYNLINKSKSIAVLILGNKKADIVQKLAEESNLVNVKQMPIVGISPESNNLIWYIDNKAMKNY